MEKLHCSCGIWNLGENNSQSTAQRQMYFKPNEIFNDERFRKLIRYSTSEENCISLMQIMSNDFRKISLPLSNDAISIRILIAEPQRTMHSSMESIEAFPPVCVEPIYTDTLRVDVSVSKVTD